MASITKSAGLGQSITLSGASMHWSYPDRIYTSNNLYALTAPESDNYSNWLRATDFGFNIPDGATIDGIKAEFEKKASAAGIEDYSVKIVQGTETGDEKKIAGDWPTSDTYIPHGGTTDKWGVSWLSADINASNFGVSISAKCRRFYDETAFVDHVRITVYYTEPSTNMKINIGDAFKDVDEIKINIGDSWKTVTKIQINIGDSWKTIFG